MADVLLELQERLGPAPRVQKVELPEPPDWATGDPIRHVWDTVDAVVRHGTPTLGYVLMANSTLWHEGENDAPAGVLYSFDEVFCRTPGRLAAVAQETFRYHEGANEPHPPQLQPWARQCQDDLYKGYARPFHQRLPPQITRRVVYHTTIMVFREHLPDGCLGDNHIVPLLVHRVPGGAAIIPPLRLWPNSVLELWKTEE